MWAMKWMSISKNMDYTDNEAIEAARQYLEQHSKPSRLEHTRGVVETAEKLALKYGADVEKAKTAAWFHDIAKNMDVEELDRQVKEKGLEGRLTGNPDLSHSKVGACLLKDEFGIDDEDILNAVAFHTTGRAGMSTLEKIIFLADAIEPSRKQPGVDSVRTIAMEDLDRACLASVERSIEHVGARGKYLDEDSIEARNWLREIIRRKE